MKRSLHILIWYTYVLFNHVYVALIIHIPVSIKIWKCFLDQCIEDNVFYWGNDILDSKEKLFFDSEKQCQAACFAESKCNVWSYHKGNKRCYLKTSIGDDIRKKPAYISGTRTCDGKDFFLILSVVSIVTFFNLFAFLPNHL